MLSPAQRRPRLAKADGTSPTLRFLRFRPEAVGLLTDAVELADGPSVDLAAIGWRDAARAETEAELFRALASLVARGRESDPLVRRSLERLSGPRRPTHREIAAREGYSYEQWLRRMKAATGVSPEFLACYRSLRAATRLARSRPSMSMGEVAVRTGFPDDAALASSARRLSARTFRNLVHGFDLPE